MGINVVHYELENWKGILASKCRLFTDIDTSFIPIGRIVTSGGISGISASCGIIIQESSSLLLRYLTMGYHFCVML